MKITLAWPQEGLGDAGETVEVDDSRALFLLHDGLARLPESLSGLNAAEVEQVAVLEGVDISAATNATDKKAAVKAARDSQKES